MVDSHTIYIPHFNANENKMFIRRVCKGLNNYIDNCSGICRVKFTVLATDLLTLPLC